MMEIVWKKPLKLDFFLEARDIIRPIAIERDRPQHFAVSSQFSTLKNRESAASRKK